ncbi:MAG: hypothetical protein AB8F78_03005 [Saprospiraceae bacterium]
MRLLLTFFALALFSASSFAVTHEKVWQDVVVEHAELSALNDKAPALDMNAFLVTIQVV